MFNYRNELLRLWSCLAIATILSSCGQTQGTQCEQIFNIARQVTSIAEEIADTSERKTWLEVANLMDTSARQLETLPTEDIELIEYKHNLAEVYQLYRKAILDAVQARENKNLAALKDARDRAHSAGKLQQETVVRINAYCINK
ncbi:hypothetical protein [Myxosarcina sp. GI1(2024)]